MINDNGDNLDSINPAVKPSINEVISALQLDGGHLPAMAYYGLSDLDTASLEIFKPYWEATDADLKLKILTDLADASEVNFDFNYEFLGYLALDDRDNGVRVAALGLLWTDESPELMARLVDLIEGDESTEVRSAALSELGRFILLGEYGDIPEKDANRAQEVAIGVLTDLSEDVEVRRRALEAISNSSLDYIREAIQDAYESDEHLMRVSAVFAMGRSVDESWNEIILRELRSDDSEIRYEAARAAGELEIDEAAPLLGQLAVTDDREIKQVAIWSLGEIGGSQAVRLLTALAEDAEEAKDEDLLEAIEDAIGYASLSGGDMDFDSEN